MTPWSERITSSIAWLFVLSIFLFFRGGMVDWSVKKSLYSVSRLGLLSIPALPIVNIRRNLSIVWASAHAHLANSNMSAVAANFVGKNKFHSRLFRTFHAMITRVHNDFMWVARFSVSVDWKSNHVCFDLEKVKRILLSWKLSLTLDFSFYSRSSFSLWHTSLTSVISNFTLE
jgi:hypothetical protein